MIAVLVVLCVILGFSATMNVVLIIGFGQQLKENKRLKHEEWRHENFGSKNNGGYFF
ncbi:hypothetical protein [uncultured Robinsoniella sp.]|uniref:hypothetical protein n=1 Tax=uncultured Robinsoniella sp. TaxID=904190 RepID=UPI00290C9497|nr:hypothetical protein [Clostridiales bacterium]